MTTNITRWNEIANEATNKPWNSFPASVGRRGDGPPRIYWGSDFVADITPLGKDGRIQLTVFNDNKYSGPPERVIPLALDDYMEERMQYR